MKKFYITIGLFLLFGIAPSHIFLASPQKNTDKQLQDLLAGLGNIKKSIETMEQRFKQYKQEKSDEQKKPCEQQEKPDGQEKPETKDDEQEEGIFTRFYKQFPKLPKWKNKIFSPHTSMIKSFQPGYQIETKNDQVFVEIDLKDFSEQDINIQIMRSAIILKAEKTDAEETKDESDTEYTYQKTMSAQTYMTSIPLPNYVDSSKYNKQFDEEKRELTLIFPLKK